MDIIKKYIKYFLVALPIIFSFIFLGYFHPSFDVVIRTNDIIGEGTCISTLDGNGERFSYLYEGSTYFVDFQ